jgi:hypothetical protein
MSPELVNKVHGIMNEKRCSFRQACAELARHRRKRKKITPTKAFAALERRKLA